MLWRQQSGRAGLTYEESVLEALCFGWIDGKSAGLDDERTMLRFSPRKRAAAGPGRTSCGSSRLLAEGLMTEAGLALVEEAKRDGSWTKLDAVEDLVVPDDLAAALAAHPGARETWDGFSRSVRRAALARIVEAKRPETRAKRVAETARLTARGERPGQWRSAAQALRAPGLLQRRPRPARPPSPGPRRPLQTGLLPVNSHVEQVVQLLARDALGQADELRDGAVAAGPAGRPGVEDAEEGHGRRPPCWRRAWTAMAPRMYTALSNSSSGPGSPMTTLQNGSVARIPL